MRSRSRSWIDDNDPTGAISVTTLRDLLSETAADLPPRPPPAPPGPDVLSKGAPVLVFSECPPPMPAPVAALELAPSVDLVPDPVPVPAAEPAAPPPPPALALRPRRAARATRAAPAVTKPRRRLRRHVFRWTLLALVVACQPWWWNVGDLRASRPTPAPTAPIAATAIH